MVSIISAVEFPNAKYTHLDANVTGWGRNAGKRGKDVETAEDVAVRKTGEAARIGFNHIDLKQQEV